jgi:hypothetical protein
LALLGLFRRREPRDAEAVGRIKAATARLLALPESTAVTVSEILCPDPACPDLETVILVMRAGEKAAAYKVRRPLADVTEQDLQEALVSSEQVEPR